MNRGSRWIWALILAVAAGLWALILWPAPAHAENYAPVVRYWEVAAPGANTDAIADLVWSGEGYPRVTIQCDTGTIVNVMVSRNGTENALGMNANTALTAGALYTFDVPGVAPGDTINVQVETDSALPVIEIGRVRSSR